MVDSPTMAHCNINVYPYYDHLAMAPAPTVDHGTGPKNEPLRPPAQASHATEHCPNISP